jgi:hypothetical protein
MLNIFTASIGECTRRNSNRLPTLHTMKPFLQIFVLILVLMACNRIAAQSPTDSPPLPDRIAAYSTVDSLPMLETKTSEQEMPENETDVDKIMRLGKRDAALAGVLSYFTLIGGQLYNQDYEKALAVVTLMSASVALTIQGMLVDNEVTVAVASFGMAGVYLFSIIDAATVASKQNKAFKLLSLQGSHSARKTELMLSPDVLMLRDPVANHSMSYTPTLGFKLKLTL